MAVRSLKGVEGTVTIPALGALIGTTHKWTATRREDVKTGEQPVFRLHAVFSYFNPFLWNDQSLRKEIRLTLRGAGGVINSQLRVEPLPDERMVLEGDTQLIIEGVYLHAIES